MKDYSNYKINYNVNYSSYDIHEKAQTENINENQVIQILADQILENLREEIVKDLTEKANISLSNTYDFNTGEEIYMGTRYSHESKINSEYLNDRNYDIVQRDLKRIDSEKMEKRLKIGRKIENAAHAVGLVLQKVIKRVIKQ